MTTLDPEAECLARAIRPHLRKRLAVRWWIDKQPPAVKIINCVLSLRRNYKKVVLPRVQKFQASHPEVESCEHLVACIESYSGPRGFMCQELDLDSARTGRILLEVTRFLLKEKRAYKGATDADRLAAWARAARPEGHQQMGVRGFGLAGFQYLRMLFGADTAKPDVHIVNFVRKHVRPSVSPLHALNLLERTALLVRKPVRTLDGIIWELGASGNARSGCGNPGR